MSEDHPFTSPASSSQEGAALATPAIPPSWPLALVLTLAAAALEAWLLSNVLLLPTLPRLTFALAAVLAVTGLVATFSALPRAALLPCVFAAPLALWSVELTDRALGPVNVSMDFMGLHMVWAATMGALVNAAWIGVPIRRLPGFCAQVGLKAQAFTIGMQFLVPGLLFIALFPLLDVVAGRGSEEGWVTMRALRGWVRAPVAGLVAWAGIGAAWLASTTSTTLWGVFVDGLTFEEMFIDATLYSFPARFIGSLVYTLIIGVTLSFATRQYLSSPE